MTTHTIDRTQIREVIARIVGRHVSTLQRDYRQDRPSAVAALAQLRRGAGKLPEDVPDLLGMAEIEQLYQELPGLERWESEAGRAERAQFLALTLFAQHQQSHRNASMHRQGVELGEAVRQLMKPGEIDERIRRRFVRVGAATGPDVLAVRLREVVALLRDRTIPLDYGLLAHRLYQAQTPGGMTEVRQRWGRSFHAYRPATGDKAADDAAPGDDTTNEDTE